MQTQSIKIADLKPAEYNPRKIDDSQMEKLKASIDKFGCVEPIVVNKDMTIIGGHQRVKAAVSLEIEELPCIVLDLDKQAEKALNAALNRISGEWDEEKLAILLQDIDEEHRKLTGFEEKELAEAINKTMKVKEDDHSVDPPKEPKAKIGDIYQLGEHRLMCGDATKKEDVEKLMDGKKADMAWTDPPYNVDYEGGTGLKIENDSMSDDKFKQFLHDSFLNLYNALDEGCPFYIAHASSEAHNFMQEAMLAGLNITQTLVWIKDKLVLGRQDYQWRHEPILYGWKPGEAHRWYGGFKNTTVIDESTDFKTWSKEELLALAEEIKSTVIKIEKPKKNKEHPTMKPLALINRALQNSSKQGDIVLDLFGGAGSTMMTCEQTQRKCYMMELAENYCDVIISRYCKMTKNYDIIKNGQAYRWEPKIADIS